MVVGEDMICFFGDTEKAGLSVCPQNSLLWAQPICIKLINHVDRGKQRACGCSSPHPGTPVSHCPHSRSDLTGTSTVGGKRRSNHTCKLAPCA